MQCLINFLFFLNLADFFLCVCVSLVLFLRVRMFYLIVFCVICLSWIGLFVHLLLTFKKAGRVRVNSLFIFQASSRTCVTSLSTGEMRHNTHLKWNTGHRVQAGLLPHFSPQAVGGLFSCPCGLAFCPHTKSSVFSDLKKSFGKLGKTTFRKLSFSPEETEFFYWLVPLVWNHTLSAMFKCDFIPGIFSG